jgi:hypothetical protein
VCKVYSQSAGRLLAVCLRSTIHLPSIYHPSTTCLPAVYCLAVDWGQFAQPIVMPWLLLLLNDSLAEPKVQRASAVHMPSVLPSPADTDPS